MSDRTNIRRKKADTTIANPSLVSSSTPTLVNSNHSLALQSNTTLPEISVQALSNQQGTQFNNERLLEGEAFKQEPLGHDISRISLRPQSKLSTGQSSDPFDPEANWVADRIMRMPEPGNFADQMPETRFRGHDLSQPSSVSQSQGHDLRKISMLPVRAKLTVSQSGDPYEQEADRVANEVMRMQIPESNEAVAMRSLRDTIHRKCAVCEEEDLVQPKSMLQRSGDGNLQAENELESRLNSSQGGGSPLPDEVRSFMEPRFGADFSQVRVHTGSEAVQMNRDLNAQAFTHKQDVYFGAAKSPGNNDLTAHELTHVVQQSGRVQANLISRLTVQRNENSDPNQQDLIKKAIDNLNAGHPDPGDVKKINPFRFNLASIDDRLKLLDIVLNHNNFIGIGPGDGYTIEHIWNSFGKDLGKVASEHFELWKQCNSHTFVDLEALPELVGIKLDFKKAIAARARGYLEDNKKLVKSEQERLGLDNPTVPVTAEQSGNVAEIVELAKKVQAAQDALDHKFAYIPVGYTKIAADDDDPNDTPKKIFVYFNPANKPDIPPDGTEKPPMATWDKTNEEYNKTSAAIDGISGKYPAIFALIRDGKINEVAQGNDQAKIRQAIAKPLKDTFDNILKTEPLLNDPGSDFALELEPIHQQFFQSEPPWNLPFQKSITQKAIQEHGSQDFWNTIGIGTMQLALFVVAELSTGGLATFFLAAGTIASAGQAAAAWQKYDQAQSAANTNLSKETALISQDQANNALFDAVLTTAFAFLDFYSAAGSALSAEAKATKLASVEAAEAKTLAEATETAEKSIGGLRNELTVEKTATGETHEFKFFKDGTIRRCSDPPCNFLIDSFKARADKALNELAADSPLRQQAEALSNEANAIQKEYTDLAKRAEKLPEAEREAQLASGEAPIRQRLEKAERNMAEIESQVVKPQKIDPYENILFSGYTDAEIAEMKTLMENWDKATYPTLANSIVNHADRHDFINNYLKYLRKANNFNKKGARKTILSDGADRWNKGNEFIIERNGKIVSYGEN